MVKKRFYVFLIQILTVCFVFCSCGEVVSCKSEEKESAASLKIACWNLQTFFDGVYDGNEYTDFASSSSGWNESKYKQRLERLCQVIEEIDADVLVFEELEKEDQLYDISNRLSGTFNFSKTYSYGYFASSPDSSIGCALMSRIPAGEASAHNIYYGSDSVTQPSMRPIIQINLYSEGKTLTLFINHWKSKSSGEESSAVWRDKQEALLVRLMENCSNKAQIILGDFNKDISEFTYYESGSGNLILKGLKDAYVYSPWILENGEYLTPGSYYYQNSWERIDHIFAAGSAAITDFTVEKNGSWADDDGHPLRYSLWNGTGYSDHFPVSCTVTF